MERVSPRLIAIGDIHGCFRELLQLLMRLHLGPDDTLVFLGDYIDRGPQSIGVVDLLLGYAEDVRAPRCVFLRGNHEQMMLDARTDDSALPLWLANGGKATLDSAVQRRVQAGVPTPPVWQDLFGAGTWSFIESTVLVYADGPYVFAHAGLDPDRALDETIGSRSAGEVLWERSHLQPGRDLSAWDGHVVVCGHTIQSAPVSLPNLVCIDTGAFLAYTHGRHSALTAVILPDDPAAPRDFVSVAAGVLVAAGARA